MTIPQTLAPLRHINDDECRRFQGSVELVGKRWSSGILLAVWQGASRFSEIVARVDGLSDRMLAQRARELEAAGLLARQVIATTPVQIRYEITERGADLLQALQPVVEWEQRWRDAPTESPRTSPGPARN